MYIKLLRLDPQKGPKVFRVLEKHNLFGWKIWLLFKHCFHQDAEKFMEEVPKESPEMLQWAEDYMQRYSATATITYGDGFGLERHPTPYWCRG